VVGPVVVGPVVVGPVVVGPVVVGPVVVGPVVVGPVVASGAALIPVDTLAGYVARAAVASRRKPLRRSRFALPGRAAIVRLPGASWAHGG
jgi:hypothetical protein